MPGYLVMYNRKSRDWSVQVFGGADGHKAALLRRLELEHDRVDDDIEIASLNSDSLETIKKTHSRYFEGIEQELV
jgi:hypothetical protein